MKSLSAMTLIKADEVSHDKHIKVRCLTEVLVKITISKNNEDADIAMSSMINCLAFCIGHWFDTENQKKVIVNLGKAIHQSILKNDFKNEKDKSK